MATPPVVVDVDVADGKGDAADVGVASTTTAEAAGAGCAAPSSGDAADARASTTEPPSLPPAPAVTPDGTASASRPSTAAADAASTADSMPGGGRKRTQAAAARHFHRHVFADGMNEDGVLVLAQGLGVRKVLSKFIQLYCGNPQALVFILNASNEKDLLFAMLQRGGVPTGSMPSIVDNEMPSERRKRLYKRGGCVFITSRILIVDLLVKRLDPSLITGFLVHRAHLLHETSNEAFILRVFREATDKGFVKAFTDDPVRLVSGFNRLERTMKALFVRKLYLWPRFHEMVHQQLLRAKLEVVELYQHMTPAMKAIQDAVLSVMKACIVELQRATNIVGMEMSLESGLFDSFDCLMRQHLGSSWATTSGKTKQVLADLKLLRKLLVYLPRYDCVTFYTFLETIRASSKEQAHPSLWLFTDEGESIFTHARNRLFHVVPVTPGSKFPGHTVPDPKDPGTKRRVGMRVVLEENPKWDLLTEVLSEVHAALDTPAVQAQEAALATGASVVVVTRNERAAVQLQEYITKYVQRTERLRQLHAESLKAKSGSAPAMFIAPDMQLLWKCGESVHYGDDAASDAGTGGACALPVQCRTTQLQQAPGVGDGAGTDVYADLVATVANLPRGNPGAAAAGERVKAVVSASARKRARTSLAFALSAEDGSADSARGDACGAADAGDEDFEVVVDGVAKGGVAKDGGGPDSGAHAGVGASDDGARPPARPRDPLADTTPTSPLGRKRVVIMSTSWMEVNPTALEAYKPTFVVMYDPEPSIVREVEVYKSLHAAKRPVRLYFLVYEHSAEHQKYLSALKKEKEAFEKLIHLKAHLALPIRMPLSAAPTPTVTGPTDGWGITMDSRARHRDKAGVSRSVAGSGSAGRVIVDIREFRSKLPSMLHQAGIEVMPITLEVGDYVLSPDICVERKSLSDLVGSLASGRLHNQAKAMTRAYKHAVLLIEFDSDRAFSLCASSSLPKDVNVNHIISKMVLLTLHFPTLRLLWSRDPNTTVQLFLDLKSKQAQPSAEEAAVVGLEEDMSGVMPDSLMRDLLMKLPGVTTYNVRAVMQSPHIANLADLIAAPLPLLRDVLGPMNAASFHSFVTTKQGQQQGT